MKRLLFSVAFIAVAAAIAIFAAVGTSRTLAKGEEESGAIASEAPQTTFDISQYGVRIEPDQRLIVMMAALDAAGFDPTPKGREPSAFRLQVRKDQADLDPELRARMKTSFERNNRANATPAEQAARYISLAYELGSAPMFEAPQRSPDLPGGLLEVLDFAPLMREFYRKSGIDERLPSYVRAYQAEADRLRQPTAEMVRNVLSYLHTRPVTTVIERVQVPNPGGDSKKNAKKVYSTREHDRRFFIVPDLLAAPGSINLRVIADDYYVIAPAQTNPASSELRRGYIQYVVDPLVSRYSRDIAAKRAEIRSLLDERANAGGAATSDVFLAVARSFVAATDTRISESTQMEAITIEARRKLAAATTPEAKAAITKELQNRRTAILDESAAELSEAYEGGAVLSFYFADQLKGLEAAGFDISNFFVDMIGSIEIARERNRLSENAEARERGLAARRLRQAQRAANADDASMSSPRATMIKELSDIDELLRLRSYAEAEKRLLVLLKEFNGEPRIFFALGQASSLAAEDATDEGVQTERLNLALGRYKSALLKASADTDSAIISRSHAAIGRILVFFERMDEAEKEFDAAIAMGDVAGGAYKEAVAGKANLKEIK